MSKYVSNFTLQSLCMRMIHPFTFSYKMHTASIAQENLAIKEQWQETPCRLDMMEQDLNQYTHLFQECIKTRALEQGKQLQTHIIKTGFIGHMPLCNLLLKLYVKCRKLEHSRRLFDKMPERDAWIWMSMITGYTQNGRSKDALELFCQMQQADVKPNRFTFAAILQACGSLAALKQGRQVHSQIIMTGNFIDIVPNNVLIDMYSKCRCTDDARKVFDKMLRRDSISWNAMLAGYSQNGYPEAALEFFQQTQRSGIELNQFAYSSVLKVCAAMAELQRGRQVHSHIIKTKSGSDVYVGSSLVDMYAKCARMADARQVFDKMSTSNVVTWTTMIAGYVQSELVEEALKLFCQLPHQDIKPDEFVFSSVLSACARLSAFEQGRQIHGHIIKTGYESQKCAGNSLIEMYSKSGCIKDARQVHELMLTRDVISWTAMIAGYAHHGCGNEALQLFKDMQQAGIIPNNITFVCVLSACSHAGLVDEGCYYFDVMQKEYGIIPTSEHYACIVDLLGRSGHIEEADKIVNTMPFKPCASVWGALLGACRVHGNTEIGRRAAENLLTLEPQCSGTHVLLSNIYAAAGKWDDAAKVRKLMKDRGVKKETGLSWVEVRSTVHTFAVGDRLHPESKRIYAMLEALTQKMKDAGYAPNTSCVLRDVEEEQKEDVLRYHSEKLALAFGLISTPTGATIRIKKNLRVCDDCHTSIKLISKIVGREIVVRDTNRFHNFNNGLCSCGDYW